MDFVPFAARTHENMLDVLMHPEAPGPSVHYYMIRGGSEKRNITVWETGAVGGEYIKTYGHYHVDDLPETYWIAHGEGIALLQKRVVEAGVPQNDRLEYFKAVRVKAGDVIHIAPREGHLVVNTGKEWLATVDDSPVAGASDSASMPAHAEYDSVKAMRGFAFYVVEQNGAPALIPNPLYKEVRKADLAGIPLAS